MEFSPQKYTAGFPYPESLPYWNQSSLLTSVLLKEGISTTSTVKSSKRPKSIKNENKSFRNGGATAKDSVGPNTPKPGPTLPKQVTTTEKELNVSKPKAETTSVATAEIKIYKKKKQETATTTAEKKKTPSKVTNQESQFEIEYETK